MALTLNKNWLILMAALGIGGIAAFGAKHYINGRVADIEAQDKHKAMTKVVVANVDLEKGTMLSADNMAEREIPKEWAHSSAITPDQFSRAKGSVLAYAANAGEAVIWSQLEGQKAPSFSSYLEVGRRAVTVPVDEISSLSGMVEPNDLIDIIVSTEKEHHNITFTLLQSVRVLATGSQVSKVTKDAEGQPLTYTTITLDASPDDAKRLIAAREIGKVTALLRSPGDNASVSASRSNAEDLLGLGGAAIPGISSVSTVPVIYGGGPITHGLTIKPQAFDELPVNPVVSGLAH